MTFADINGGRPYVEDFTYTDEVRISTLDCSSFTNPYQMKEYTEMRLADYAKPTISYVLNAMDLSVLTGYEHEAWELGDYVRVEDKELGLSVTTRIVRREYNLQEDVRDIKRPGAVRDAHPHRDGLDPGGIILRRDPGGS